MAGKRVVGRPFQKGNVANPGGRPKIPADVRDAARAHTTEAIEALVKALRAKSESVRVRAAEALLDRAWGKPALDVTATIKAPTPEQLDDRLRALAIEVAVGPAALETGDRDPETDAS